MKSDKRTIFLFIYALIIIVALIYILFIAPDSNFYSKTTGQIYDVNSKVIDTDLKNGSRIILI